MLTFNFGKELKTSTFLGEDTASVTGTKRNILKKVPLGIVESSKCEQALRSTRLGANFSLDSTFICAGGVDGVDTCQVFNSFFNSF